MGTFSKEKAKVNRRKFGQPAGMRSRSYKRNTKNECIKKEQKSRVYREDKRTFLPYQLVRKQMSKNGKYITTFTVRRIRIQNMKKTKLCCLGSLSLKFVIKRQEVSGHRIINIDTLKNHVVDISMHACLCEKAQELAMSGKAPIVLKSEMNQCGLFSVIVGQCLGCNEDFFLNSSNNKGANGLYDINVRAVWGTVCTGGGPAQLNETLASMDMPQVTDRMFIDIENKIGEWWLNALQDELLKAGAEEKRLAIERNDLHQGVPYITVICDGGWSKRTHKHSYNALGGVGVIFGAETKKLLYIGVRNKQCVICQSAEGKNMEPKQHNCFRNWSESSQSMESDIILQGFLEAESMHGLRYLKVIADGDSSVYSKLVENVPLWGGYIKKLECANHTCKCLRSNLEKLVQEKRHFKGKGKLTPKTIVRLTTGVRCAIKFRSSEKDVKKLKHDIKNSIYHVLGFHSNCSDFCKNKKINAPENEDDCDNNKHTSESEKTNSFDEIFSDQTEYWNLPSDLQMQESRLAQNNKIPFNSDIKEIIRDVSVLLNRVAEKSERLIGNFTSNLAESWMSIRCKFDGGKFVNRCSRGSWNTRCYGGALRKNIGPAWSPLTFQKVTDTQPGNYFLKHARGKCLKMKSCNKYRSTEKYKNVRRKRKLQSLKESSSKKAKRDYGSPLDDTQDVSDGKLKELCDSFYEKNVKVNENQIKMIEKMSRQQSQSQIWKIERRKRLTSSNFGKIISRRPTNVSDCIVKNMLYSNFKGNINTIRGIAQEENTILEYQNKKSNVEVKKVGLIISNSHPYLAASPDGLVTDGSSEGLIEIKNFLQNNKYSINEAITKIPNFCLENIDGKIQLKRKHEIYMQIQGQLNITEKNWCDFVLRRTNPYDIFIERIYKDETLWTEVLPKLTSFYKKFLLPELACPRHGTYSGIRKPQSPWYVQPAPNDVSARRKTSHRIQNKSKTSHLIPNKGSHGTNLQQQCNDRVSANVQYVAPLLSSDGSKTSLCIEHSSSHGTDLQQQCNDRVSANVQYVAPLLSSDGSKTSLCIEHSSSHGTDLQQQCNDTVPANVQYVAPLLSSDGSKTSLCIEHSSSHGTDLQQQCNDTVSANVQYVAPLLSSDGSKTSLCIEHSSSHGTDLQQQCNDTVSANVQYDNVAPLLSSDGSKTSLCIEKNSSHGTNLKQQCSDTVSTLLPQQPMCSSEELSVPITHGRSRRLRLVKFVGRKILHEWCVEGKRKNKKKKWYSGMVLDVVRGEFCLENLNTDSVVDMTTDVLGDNFDDIGDTIVCTSDVETWKKWTSGIWHLIQGKFRKSVQRFSDIPIFPLVSDSNWEKTGEFTLLKLTSPLLYVPSLDEFADKENISRAFHLLSVRLIQFIPDCIDIEVVRQFLHEETSESLTELFDRINDVERYNIECAVDDSEIFLKFLSERIHTKLGNVGSETLRHLKIFRGYQSTSESQLVSLAQTHDIYEGTHFPVRFPKEVILVKSDQERTFASHLGANSVSELELVRITLRNIVEYDPHERQIFIKWLISNVAHFSYHDVQDRLKEVDFLEATDGSFHKVGDLFDPSSKELCDLFRNEHVFPKVNIENEQQFLNGLRQLGLKTICDITSVDIESICCKIHEMAFGNSAFDDTMCRALLHVMNKSGHLVDKSRVHDKKCILIEDMVMVDNFPQFIPLKNKEIGVAMLLCRPDEIKSIKFLNLIGSVVHVVDCKNLETLSAIFEWETSPAIENVIEHLFNVVQHYKPEYKADCIPIITSIYNHLSDADRCRMSEVRELIQSMFKAPLDAFVWDGNAFQSIHNVYAEIAKGDIDMKPFLHPLPVEIKHMSSFFVSLGCPESLDLDMYLATLGRIKDSEKITSGDENLSDAFIEMAVSILNKLKKNFLQELRDREIQLFFPTLNENGSLRMLPADCCTYCDEQWLKNMDFQFDDDVHYVHPDLPLATAEALGVPSLRQQMMSDTEAFEEWGQEEPLTRRLRNLLKEGYVDGFCVAKELFQNADDARARKLWIMYDERENNDAKSQLISEGMADCQGPAIWVYNDEQFTEGDFKNITKLSGATKEEDSTKIGKFGLGFCAVYNITDVPSFLSGENFIIFDPDMSHLGKVLPGRSPGLRINFRVMKNLKMMKSLKNQFMPFENVFGCKIADESSPYFNGTLFRLPLRNRASDICDVVYSSSEVKQLFGKIMSMAANMFLFNQNVTEFKLFHLPKTERNPYKATLLYEINKTSARLMPSVDMNVDIIPVLVETTRRKQAKSLHDKPLRVVDRISVRITNYTDSNFQVLESKTDSCVDWLVSWSSGTHETTLRLTYEDKGALPLAAVAIPVSYERSGISCIPEIKVIPFKSVQDQFYQKGHLFFFLPLPIQHRFLFHINSQFTITTDRRQLKTSTEDDKNTKMKEWNKYLMKDSVANALLNLLENLHQFGNLSNYQYDSLWPKSETTEILEYLPHAFYQKVVQPELCSVFERDGQWFDISKCVFMERNFRNSDVGDIAFEFLSQLTEFVVDVSEEKYNMLRQADQSSIDEKTVTKESFFIDFFFPHLEDFSSDKSVLDKRKKLLYFAVECQEMTINQWLRTNKCIPSQPYGDLKRPNELVDLNSTLAALFVASDGRFPESPFTHRNILEKLRNLGIMWNVLDDALIKDRACSVEHLTKKCSVCAMERADHVIGYLSDNISNHGSVIPDLQNIKFLPIQPKPQTWPFDWHADIFASSKSSKKCKTHRKLNTAYETTFFDRASNMFYSDCKNIIGCVAFVFDNSSFFKCNTVNKSTHLKTMLNALGMKGMANGDVDVRFVLNQVDCISVSYHVSSNRLYFTTASQIMGDIYRYLDAACESRNIFDIVAGETKDKSFVFVREAFISPKRISQKCYEGCKPYLFSLIESPLSLCSTLCKCLDIKDNFPPYEVALILQNVKQEKMNTPLHQSEIQTMINILFCLRRSIYATHGKDFEVQSIVNEDLVAIYGPDENGMLRDCKSMCFNDYDDIEKDDSMMYAHDSFSPSLAKYFGVKPKLVHNLEQSSEDIEDFYQEEPLVTRLNRLVDGYPCDSGIFKELIQNADDAEATEIHFVIDYTTHPSHNIIDPRFAQLQGPALLVYNNSAFSNDDLRGITKLGRGSKSDDPSQTGRYGVGFNAVYNLTDAPSFYTKGGDIENGETLCFFDPLAKYIPNVTRKKPGKRYKNVKNIRLFHRSIMDGYHENILMIKKTGTIFRFPLRTKAMAEVSEIKQEAVEIDTLSTLLKSFEKELCNIMLFLKHLTTVQISTCRQDTFVEEFCIDVSMISSYAEARKSFVQQQNQLYRTFSKNKEDIFKFKQYTAIYELSMNLRAAGRNIDQYDYLIVQTLGFDENKPVHSLIRKEMLNGKLGLLPHGGVALRVSKRPVSAGVRMWEAGKNCKAFCFLPLPIETGLPVHIHGYFALDHETRRTLWRSEEFEKCYRSLWNRTLVEQVISRAYVFLLEYTKETQFKGISDGNVSKTTTTYLLTNYQTLFPLKDTLTDSYWQHLLCTVYIMLVEDEIAFLPVQNSVRNEYDGRTIDQLTWTSFRSKGSDFPAYIKAESSSESHLNRILRRIGMRIVYISDGMKVSLNFAGVDISLLEPHHVIEFMCNPYCQPVGRNECRIETEKHVVRTALQSVGDAVHILQFCLKDSKCFLSNLMHIPLMITQDHIVRTVFTSESLLVEEQDCFCHFFPTELHRFLQSSIATTLNAVMQQSNIQNKLKRFCLLQFVALVKETNMIEYDCACVKAWDKSNPSEDWIRLFWDFFLYRFNKDNHHFGQQLQVVHGLPLIPVTKKNSDTFSLVQPGWRKSILNLGSFSTNRPLHAAFTKMNLPLISDSSFSNVFMEKGFALLHEQLPNFGSPLEVLECLHTNSNDIEFSKLTDECANVILQYFNDFFDNKSTGDIQKLKELPLFLSHFGKRVALKKYSRIYIVHQHLPRYGLEELADKANVLFLRNTGKKNLFKLLDLQELTVMEVYIRYIIPQQFQMSRNCFYQHLCFLSTYIYIESDDFSKLLGLLRGVAFIEVQNGQTVLVSDLFDSEHAVFKRMCKESELVPTCLRESSILRLFRKIGLKFEMTVQLFERFAKEIEVNAQRQTLTDKIQEDSIELTKHLLSMKEHFFQQGNLTELAKINFVLSHNIDEKLASIKEQYNPSTLICFEEAVLNSSRRISWTVMNILPLHADPSSTYRSDLIISKLGIRHKPCVSKLINHCKIICTHLVNVLEIQNTVSHDELKLVMGEIYDALNFFLNAKELSEENLKTLTQVPIVYYPETKILISAKCVTISCKQGEEIPPYLMKYPEWYGQFNTLFLNIGAFSEPSFHAYAHVLKLLRVEAGDSMLGPKEVTDSKMAMGLFYKNLAEETATVNIPYDGLVLLSRRLTLEPARTMVVPNNKYLQQQLAKNTTTTCLYHIDFDILPCLHLKHESFIEALEHLPEQCRPHLLTDVAMERVILENIKQEDERKSILFKDFIQGNDFVCGFLRLVRHVWKSEKKNWTENDAELMTRSLQTIRFTHCSGIETKLALRCIENGILGREELVEHTNEHKSSHIEISADGACIYFDRSDENWQRNINKHLTMYLNKLAGQCLKNEFLVCLMDILSMHEKPEGISLFLSKEQIEEYTFQSYALNDHNLYPTPGKIVPEEFYAFLDNDFLIFEYDYKFMALEVDDPAFNSDEAQESENEEETGQHLEATYIFVHVVRKIGPENQLPLFQEYEIDDGSETVVKVKGSQLFKFVRKTKNNNAEKREVVIYERNGNESNNESPPERNQRQTKSMKEVRREIREYLRQAWKEGGQEKRRIVKRLFLKWHPDKNPDNVPFCTKVFQYIQSCLSRLEKGLGLTDDDEEEDENETNSNSSSSGSSQSYDNSWYNRSWRRYTWGRQNNERRYEEFWSSQGSRRSGGSYRNFEDSWRSRYTHTQGHYQPYQWHARAKLWYKQAEHDLQNARASVEQLQTPKFNWVCYNAHQAAEKALKAVWYAKDANKVDSSLLSNHNLEYIASVVGSEAKALARRLSQLTGDHAKMLYPQWLFSTIPAESFSRHNAELAIEIAQDILNVCRLCIIF